jgi:hypothetical protein
MFALYVHLEPLLCHMQQASLLGLLTQDRTYKGKQAVSPCFSDKLAEAIVEQ